MANRVVLYTNGLNSAVAGSADGDVLTWDAATNEWQSVAPAGGSFSTLPTYYVTVGGNDTTGDGSISAPYATIQKAHDEADIAYVSGQKVVINVGPGSFTGNVNISRYNTFIVGAGARPEDQVTKIIGAVEVNCTTATDLYNQQVGIDGCFIEPSSAVNTRAVFVVGSAPYSVIITNCYLTTNNAGSSSNALYYEDGVGTSARVVMWNCIASVQAASIAADIIYLNGGNHRLADTQIQHASTVLATANSRGLRIDGASYLLADRLLIETKTNRYAVRLSGTAYGSFTAKATLGNVAVTSSGVTGDGIECNAPGLTVLMTDMFFTVTSGRTCISGTATTPVAIGQLSFAPTFSNTLSITLPVYNNETHGQMKLPALTATRPLKLNGSQVMVADKIDLASSDDVTGSLPASSVSSIPYDIAGEVPGTPDASAEILHFIAVRAFTLNVGGVASCVTAPSGSTVFDVAKNGSSVGNITYTSAGVTGTVTITAATSFVAGDILTVTAPAGLNGIDSPFFTFAAVL